MKSHWKIIQMVLLNAFVLCGCSSRNSDIDSMVKKLTVSEKTFLAITNGESFEAATNILGIAARLEFMAAETNGNYTLINCFVPDADGPSFWLLFRDKKLFKIIKPFSFPEQMETYPYEGTTASRIKSWDIDDPGITQRIRKVIDAPNITHDDIINDLRPNTNTTSGSWNVFPAFILSGWFWKVGPKIEKDYKANEQLLEHYYGCQANLGLSAEDVEKLYGKPLRVFSTKNGETARIYGDTRHLEFMNSLLSFIGLAIVTDAKGRVTAIYSDWFFNEEWKK
jgi:hypothetical protein